MADKHLASVFHFLSTTYIEVAGSCDEKQMPNARDFCVGISIGMTMARALADQSSADEAGDAMTGILEQYGINPKCVREEIDLDNYTAGRVH